MAMSAELYICEPSALLGHVVDVDGVVVDRCWPIKPPFPVAKMRLRYRNFFTPAAQRPGYDLTLILFAKVFVVKHNFPSGHFAPARRSRPFSPCSRTASLNT
jgi:hypothetical protein